jgi:glutathione S-transferase
MLTLHHCRGARSFRVLWALEELGLDYTLHMMPFPPRLRHEGYLALNPLGTVPTFTDGDTMMTESSAICHYLAARHGAGTLAVEPHEPGYAAYLNFLVMGEATLTFPQTIFLRYAMFEPPERRLPQAAADYTQWFASRLKAAAALLGRPYAAAGRFTAADISFGYAIRLANTIGLASAIPAAVQDYWDALQQRPAYRRAEAADAGEPANTADTAAAAGTDAAA